MSDEQTDGRPCRGDEKRDNNGQRRERDEGRRRAAGDGEARPRPRDGPRHPSTGVGGRASAALERCPTIIKSYEIISDSGFALNPESGQILGIIFQDTPREADLLLTYPAAEFQQSSHYILDLYKMLHLLAVTSTSRIDPCINS